MVVSSKQLFTTTAYYKGTLVAVKKINRKSVEINKTILMELKQVILIHIQCIFSMCSVDTIHLTGGVGNLTKSLKKIWLSLNPWTDAVTICIIKQKKMLAHFFFQKFRWTKFVIAANRCCFVCHLFFQYLT